MANDKVKSSISTIYRGSVTVPQHLHNRFGHTTEYSTFSAATSSMANVAASGQNAYGEVEEWAEDSDRACVEFWVSQWEAFLASLEPRDRVAGSTHYADTYGERTYYRRRAVPHLNQVSEEWQNLVRWEYWEGDEWVDVGSGFSTRRLKAYDAGQ